MKAQVADMAAKDKKNMLTRFKQSTSKWRLELWLVETLLEHVFSRTPEALTDLRPIVRREFSQRKITGP